MYLFSRYVAYVQYGVTSSLLCVTAVFIVKFRNIFACILAPWMWCICVSLCEIQFLRSFRMSSLIRSRSLRMKPPYFLSKSRPIRTKSPASGFFRARSWWKVVDSTTWHYELFHPHRRSKHSNRRKHTLPYASWIKHRGVLGWHCSLADVILC